jgi:dTDP-4-dehydrorhamnose reductase
MTHQPLRILLLGNCGQLGWELERTLNLFGELQSLDYPEIDLANSASIRQVLKGCKPHLLVNAAAYTAVDRAESEPDLANSVNAVAPGILADLARQTGAAFIHYSTDYVFDGLKGSTYVETDLPNPISVYGRTKLAGEQVVQQVGGAYIILRTSWVYSMRRDSFVTKVLGWARSQTSMKLVIDQISGPTWARLLAQATTQMIASGRDDPVGWIASHAGLFHLAGAGYCSRLEWGQEVLRIDRDRDTQIVREVLPASSVDFPTPARRPNFSALNCDYFTQTFHFNLPDWKAALKLAMDVE